MPRIALEGLRKIHHLPDQAGDVVALDGLTLEVEDGELLTVVGPSGSGKTTLLRLIAGLDALSAGCIRLDGRDLAGVPPEQRGVGMVFQRGALFPHLTVWDNVALGLRLRGLPGKEIAARVTEAAARLGIGTLLGRWPAALSAGERQRVALGRALAAQPAVMLLDEPLAALDAPLRTGLRREIARLHADGGLTMIHVTHDQDEALSLGTRVAVLCRGALQQVARPRELLELPANVFVAGFVGAPGMNLLRGRAMPGEDGFTFVPDDAGSEGLPVTVPAAVASRFGGLEGRRVVMGVRVEDTHLVGPLPAGTGCGVAVEVVEVVGGRWIAGVKCGAQPLAAEAGPADWLHPGARVTLAFNLGRACWFDSETGLRLWP